MAAFEKLECVEAAHYRGEPLADAGVGTAICKDARSGASFHDFYRRYAILDVETLSRIAGTRTAASPAQAWSRLDPNRNGV